MNDQLAQTTASMVETIRLHDLDKAETLWFQLRGTPDAPASALACGAFILLQRGQALEALHYLRTLPDDCCPDLKTLCTCLTGDPIWRTQAAELEEGSADPMVRSAMRQLLGKEEAIG